MNRIERMLSQCRSPSWPPRDGSAVPRLRRRLEAGDLSGVEDRDQRAPKSEIAHRQPRPETTESTHRRLPRISSQLLPRLSRLSEQVTAGHDCVLETTNDAIAGIDHEQPIVLAVRLTDAVGLARVSGWRMELCDGRSLQEEPHEPTHPWGGRWFSHRARGTVDEPTSGWSVGWRFSGWEEDHDDIRRAGINPTERDRSSSRESVAPRITGSWDDYRRLRVGTSASWNSFGSAIGTGNLVEAEMAGDYEGLLTEPGR